MKSARPIAQRLLALLPDGPALMSAHLAEKKADAREESATWIGRHGTPADADVLQARLEKETDAGVRAALLGALIRLGTSAEQLLSPRALTQESVEHADADASIPSWFSTEQLPALTWADGATTPASVAPWWLIYADRIGDPIGKGLIPRYLDTLAPASADALGRVVLDAWIAQDTLHPTEEAVRADPDDYYARVINMTHPDGDSERTPAEKMEYALRFRHVVYLTSAIDHRGMLALATRTDGAWFADRVSRFLRDHRARRAQSEALLRATSAHPSDEALQLLLGVARRYRQKTIQALALELITDLADRRGWTPLQLADRTVPYAGLDDQGQLVLDFGPRQFVAEVSDALTLSLYHRIPQRQAESERRARRCLIPPMPMMRNWHPKRRRISQRPAAR